MKMLVLFALAALMMNRANAGTMEVKEVDVLLRSGVSQTEITEDVHRRKITRIPNGEEIVALKAHGATPAFLAMLADKASLVSRSEDGAYKDRIEERKRLEKLTKVWVYGCLYDARHEGGYVVACTGLNPSILASPEARAEGSVYFAILPPAFRGSPSQALVNCEAAIVGMRKVKTADGREANIQEVVLLHDLGAVTEAPRTASVSQAPTVAAAK